MNKKVDNWSKEIVPRRLVEWEDGQNELAVLLVPRFRKGIFAKWLQPRLKKPYIKVSLDEFGSFIWRRIDGRTCFSEMTKFMEEKFGERISPSEERLQKFLLILQQNGFVELLMPA